MAQLYNTYYNGLRGRGRGAITMQDESTLDNSGGVLKIIADLASPGLLLDKAPELTVKCGAPRKTLNFRAHLRVISLAC